MPHAAVICRLILADCVLLACLAAPASAARECVAGGSPVPTATTMRQTAASVVQDVNRERAARDLPRLRVDRRLARAGRRHARDMVRRGFFSHVTPTGRRMTERVEATGYLRDAASWALGETLAWGTGSCSTPTATVTAWMESPPHRRILLGRRYREIGVGVELGTPLALSPAGAATYAAELGIRQPVSSGVRAELRPRLRSRIGGLLRRYG